MKTTNNPDRTSATYFLTARGEAESTLRRALSSRNEDGYTSRAWNRAFCRRLIARVRRLQTSC